MATSATPAVSASDGIPLHDYGGHDDNEPVSSGQVEALHTRRKIFHPPFGSGAPRFTAPGYHPGFLKPEEVNALPREKEMRLLGPGCYVPCAQMGSEKVTIDIIMERRCQRRLKSGKKEDEKLGPGMYHIKGFIENLDKKPSSRKYHVCGTQEPRFVNVQEKNSSAIPGPGSYKTKDMIQDQGNHPRSLLGICDASIGDRFPYTTKANLGPFYNRKSVIEETLEHGFSKRGIYDLTSGPRFKQSPQFTTKLGPGQYEFVSFTEILHKGTHKKHGIVYHPSTADASSRRSMTETPGPSHYSPHEHQSEVRPFTAPPFGSTAKRFGPKLSRFPEVNNARDLFPGPGFYNNPQSKNKRLVGNISSFKSSTKRFAQ